MIEFKPFLINEIGATETIQGGGMTCKVKKIKIEVEVWDCGSSHCRHQREQAAINCKTILIKRNLRYSTRKDLEMIFAQNLLSAIKKHQSIVKLRDCLNVSDYKLRCFLFRNYRKYLRINKKEVKNMTMGKLLLDLNFRNYLKAMFQ